MKIIMVGPGRQCKGGITSVVNQYYEAGLDKLTELTYVTSTRDGNRLIKILYALLGIVKFLFIVDRCEIVHVHMSSRVSFMRKKIFIDIAKKKSKKIIIHMHSGEFDIFYNEECDNKKKNIIKKTLAQVDSVIVLSEKWYNFFSTICNKDKLSIMYNSVIIPEFRRDRFDDHNILYFGRLNETKGIYDLLYAMANVVKKIPDVHLYFGGDGKIDEIVNLINDLSLSENITYLGWATGERKEKMFMKCSVFVLPSYYEGMPMSILEAMSYGEIVISTIVGGIPNIINNRKNGFLIKPGDVDELSNVITEVLRSCDKSVLSYESYYTIMEKFNASNSVQKLYKLYRELLKDVNG